MTGSQDGSSATRVILAFNERYWNDEAQGRGRPLSHYLALFPEHEDLVAAEFIANRKGDIDAAPTDAGGARPARVAGQLGPYLLDAELGRGGQGVVYRATDTRLGRTVALKVLTGLGPGAESQVARFRREAEAASRLEHPGICGVHDAGIEDGVPYIAMRFVEGETLATMISRSKVDSATTDDEFISAEDDAPQEPQPKKRPSKGSSSTPSMTRNQIFAMLGIFEKAARALHAAHEGGVLHRDIKPGNIMVTTDGEPVLLDFGLASIDSDDAGPTLTRTGEVFGTPAYMSPEQVTGQRVRLDRRSDVYSLGVTLYECLTGARPFEAPTREALYQAVLTKEPQDPRKLNKAIPADLKVVVETALAKDRDKRYQSAQAFADDLAAAREDRPIAARPVGPIGRAVRWARRRPMRAALTAALIVGIPLVTGLSGYIWANLPNIEAQKKAQADEAVESALEVGYFELHEGAAQQAVAAFEAALAADPASPEAIAGLALAQLRIKAPQSALETIVAGERRLAVPGVMARVKSDALVALGRQQEADAVLARAPDIKGSLLWFLEGMRAMREGHAGPYEGSTSLAAFHRARAALEKAVAASPHARRAYHFELAHATAHCSKTIDPEPMCAVLEALWPRSAKAWLWIAYSRHARDPEGGIAACRRAIALDPARADAWGELGYALFRRGDLDGSLEALTTAEKIGPSSSRFRQVLGIVLAAKGRAEEAVALFETELRADAASSGLFFNYGIALDACGRTEEAIEKFRRAIELNGKDAQVHQFLAGVLEKCNRRDAAIEALRTAVGLEPTWPSLRLQLGIALMKAERFEAATPEVREAIRLDGDLLPAQHALAEILARTGRFEEALAAQLEIVRRAPKDARARVFLAKLFGQRGRFEEAIRHAEAAIELDPKLGSAYFWLGAGQASLGDRGRGLENLQTAVRLDPKSADHHNGLGHVYEESGDIDAAVASYRRAFEIDPAYVDARVGLARLRLRQHAYDDVIEQTRIVIRDDPKNADAYFYLGCALDKTGAALEAAELLAGAIEKIPTDAYLYDLLAGIQFRAGAFDKAESTARAGLRADARFAPLHYRLAGIFKTTNREAEAIEAFREAIRIDPEYAEAHCDFGLLLARMGGRFAEAVPLIRRGHELGRKRGAAWEFPSLIWLDQALCDLARTLDDDDQTEKAVALLREHLSAFPDLSMAKKELRRLEE